MKSLHEIMNREINEYEFNAHARTVSKAKNFKKGMDNTTYNITYVKGKSIATEKGLIKSDMVNWVNKLKKAGYKIEGIIDSNGRDAGTQRANLKGVFKESLDETAGINKKLFGQYADEILLKTIKTHHIKDDEIGKRMKQIQMHINHTMQNMSQGKSNPNRGKYQKYIPAKYDDGMFTNNGNNSYESQFWQMKDAERDTITRGAVQRYMKKHKLVGK